MLYELYKVKRIGEKLVGEKNENMGNNSIYVKMRQVKFLLLLVSSLIIE